MKRLMASEEAWGRADTIDIGPVLRDWNDTRWANTWQIAQEGPALIDQPAYTPPKLHFVLLFSSHVQMYNNLPRWQNIFTIFFSI